MFYYVLNNTNTLWFPYDKNYVSKQLGITYFHYYDVKSYLLENVFVNKSLSSKEKATVTNYFESKNKEKTTTNFHGIAKDKT
jgi:lipoteichoic acid synthase